MTSQKVKSMQSHTWIFHLGYRLTLWCIYSKSKTSYGHLIITVAPLMHQRAGAHHVSYTGFKAQRITHPNLYPISNNIPIWEQCPPWPIA